ncbi:DUF6209 family protein [Labilithrix luteola]|nr:DUF6209 family protein [Labilithrix luteola]
MSHHGRLWQGMGVVTGVLALSLFGCAETSSEDEVVAMSGESALGEAGTITFSANGDVRVQGTLERGKTARVAYDADRLTTCRGEQGGLPAWTISGYYRIAGGVIRSFEAGGLSPSHGTDKPVLTLDSAGDLEVWFQNTSRWGCNAYDSDFGRNFHFSVNPAASDPGWIGNLRAVVSRMTCDGGKACESDMDEPENGEVRYDTWARQRAAIRSVFFEVWKDGVTNWDNSDLWQQLDVQLHSRASASAEFQTSYVSFDRRVGNNARYEIPLRPLDPIPGNFTVQKAADCPNVDLGIAADGNGAHVETVLEYYVTVNGVEFRPAGGGTFRVRFQNYADLYAVCLPH